MLEVLDLLERERELTTLTGALDSASTGNGRVVTVSGEPGIGKSSLLAAAAATASRRGLAVLRARGTELESDIPFGVVLQLLERPVASLPEPERGEVLRGAAALARPLLEAGPSAGEPSPLHGLYWLAANLAELRPLALLVDDAQWADPPSLNWLNYLAHRVEELPVVLVAAFRGREPSLDASLVDALAAQPTADSLSPAPLSEAAIGRIVRARHPTAGDDFCDACAHLTQGNPFLLRELLEVVERRGVDPVTAGRDELTHLAPQSVTRLALERLDRVGGDAIAVARAAAVLGDGCAIDHVASLAGVDAEAAGDTVGRLVRAEVLRGGERLTYRHPLLRSTVYEDVPAALRSDLHARAARLLADEGAQPDRLAAHLLHSPPEGSRWAVDTLRIAAERARAGGAPTTAVALLTRALAEPPRAETGERVLIELAHAEAAAGDERAVGHFADALERVRDPGDRVELSLALARTLSSHGRGAEAAAALDGMLDELADERSEAALALQATWIAISRTDVSLRERVGQRIRHVLAAVSDDPSHEERMMLAQLASERVFAGEPRDEAVELARLAYGDGRLLDVESCDGSSWVVALGALGWSDHLDEFERGFLAGLDDARRRGSVLAFATCSYALTFSHYYTGRLADAVADAHQALVAERYGWREYIAACRAQLAWALVDRDELDQASDAIAPLEADPAWQAHPAYAFVAEARGRIALARGEPTVALEWLLEAGRRIEAAQIPNPAVLPWASLAAVAASASDPDRARELAARELTAARRFGAPRAVGMALRAAGVVHGGDEGLELLQAAVAELDRSPAALERTRALVDLGAALHSGGHSRDAREPLRVALDQAHRMGAFALERRARAELVATGARPRRPVMTGVDSLTPSEHRVASMAAAGMSNREIAEALFVTIKAIQWHLGHAYRKLGITRRSELPPPRAFH